MRVNIMGVGFDDFTLDESIDHAMEQIDSRSRGYVVTPNPEIVWMANRDEDFMEAVSGASLVLPDGVGIVYAAKILKQPLERKVTGIDFAMGVIDRLSQNSGTLYLLGAKPGVAEKAAAQLEEQYPGVRVLGVHDGYFDRDDEIIAEINSLRPDFLLVCLGAPRQEKWMRDNRDRLDVGIMAGLGGVLDVLAGTVERAPESWQKRNLEWLYRLIKEPSRIKRQIRLPLFLLDAVGRRIKGGE